MLEYMMDTYLDKIIKDNKELFNRKSTIKKINIGFTNLLYSVDNKYIVKICNNKENENNFNTEIRFYKNNINNNYIPKLYSYHISTSDEDYSYEIIEKINGKSLYYVWHTFTENQRKNMVKEIVKLMKSFHSVKGYSYDWGDYIINKLKNDFHKCFELKLFSNEEIKLAKHILTYIKPYLKSSDFRLVHSDIHFDNILLCSDGQVKIYEHRNGVIFPYLDNDIGNYKYLETFIKLVYVELGVTTRISTVGYSRYNLTLNDMHERINSLDGNGLGGVRLSFTPYEIGWECLSENFSRFDYIMDMANLLKIYRTYYENVGTGSRNMCVEIRYKPLVRIKDVNEIEILGHKVIYTSNYLWISKNKDVNMREAKIKDPYEHSILLTEDPEDFYTIDLYEDIQTIERLKKIAHKFIMGDLSIYPISKVYLMINYDGYYYSINPSITEDGNYGINIYPKTETRKHSGYIITERFLVNSIIEYKKTKNLLRLEKFENSTWEDVYEVIKICKNKARKYKKIGKTEKSDYIINEILPMINAYISALQIAGYKAKDFFDPEFSIDTGIICNLGRAIHEFQGLTSKENEPLTPVHERNYGMYNSKMSREGISWRLSCNYDNSIVIEKLNMFDTASEEGQVAERINIKLENKVDEIYTVNDLKTMYLVPGQRLK